MYTPLHEESHAPESYASFSTQMLWEYYWDYRSMLSAMDKYSKGTRPWLVADARRILQEIEAVLAARAEEDVRKAREAVESTVS